MLHRDFESFINALSLVWVNDETLHDIGLSVGINPTDWPECDAKDLVTKYESLWPRVGHVKARRELANQTATVSLKANTDLIPNDINSLRAAYDSFEFIQDAFETGIAISENPSKAFDIFSKLQTPKNKYQELYDVAEISREHFDRLCRNASHGDMIRNISRWEKLSEMIAGFNPGRLGMILAESGFGKSNLCLNLALSAQQSMRVVYFNMEMLIEDMMDRIHVVLSQVSWKDLKSGNIPVYDSIEKVLVKDNLLMSDGVDKSLDQIRITIQRLNRDRKVDLVIVDYDQKILLKYDSRTPEWKALQDAFVGLESLAKECQTYILVAAQSSNEEGKVSGSLRSKFPCSTVLFFHDHEIHGPIISVKKNRFESVKQFLKVDYNPQSSSVKEKELIYASPEKAEVDESAARRKSIVPRAPPSYSDPYRD